ncbi:prenylcysteine oxidase 1-like [Antedon mediterranea]|uniref:prenylcysteine oxidase 1-like n=1 Tax=Antedon mediterranea TaxID=105859 RepID=UPI003AF64DD4
MYLYSQLISLIVCFLLIPWSAYALFDDNKDSENVAIAVIGGGISGTSCSYFLPKVFGDGVSVTLFEPNEIGGRMATVELANRFYESGGSVLHEKNVYMDDFLDQFDLKKADSPDLRMGIYNGKEFVYEEGSSEILNILKLLWRYKLDFIYLNSEINKMIDSFSSIYDIQSIGYSFSTPELLLAAMDEVFLNYTKMPLADVLKGFGLSQRLIDELATVATRENYGQSVNMTAFAGLISLAGVQPGLWSVFNGNKQVCENLIKVSKATLIKRKVMKVRGNEDNSYTLYWNDEETGKLTSKDFDIVVVATPLQDKLSKIDFENISPPIHYFKGEYQRTVANFVHGTPNSKYFGKPTLPDLPEEIMTTVDGKIPIRGLALKIPVDYETGVREDIPYVYKIFTERPLSDEEINELFLNVSEVKIVDWLAYPNYSTNDKLPPYQLSQNLYYTSGLEWAASAMEIGAISGKNVAQLAYQNWIKNVTMIDSYIKSAPKVEL